MPDLSMFTTAAPEIVKSGADALVENADRLGLKWRLRYATIKTLSPLTAVYDGDTTAINMVSLLEEASTRLKTGTRVAALYVPPSGNFIYTVIDNPAYTHNTLRGEVGTATISFTTQTSFTQSVSFAVPFSVAPVITTNIASGSGSTSGWGSRAISITTSGFSMFVFGASSTWSSIPVQWMALGN